jgi:hypothetical protein
MFQSQFDDSVVQERLLATLSAFFGTLALIILLSLSAACSLIPRPGDDPVTITVAGVTQRLSLRWPDIFRSDTLCGSIRCRASAPNELFGSERFYRVHT